MANYRLLDTVTLRHFGVINRMDIVEMRLTGYDRPAWTDAVRSELLRDANGDGCGRVLEATFLGTPEDFSVSDLAEIFRIQRALSGDTMDPLLHLGEAESIWAADRRNGTFITDDAAAFDFAEKNLGNNRVLDCIDLLRESVAAKEITEHEAKLAADAIRNSGRHLKAGHPPTLTTDYFC
jgi:hypothetical protein